MSADKDYLSLPLRELLADIAAKRPTPGGGSVAALVGSLSCSLACMALQFTIGKPKYAAHDAELKQLLADLTQAGEKFMQLMSEDMRAYEAVMAARKQDPAAFEAASVRATEVPLNIVRLAESVLTCLDELKAYVNMHLLSDLRAAAVLARAVVQSAAGTARDNLPGLADREQASRMERQLDALVHQAEHHAQSVAAYRPH
ncbi:MAG TPA: cyclodeaminase/cyclohydrolase family protein [Phycisphaerae bacterium]|nr:cyclodeaminase/cyclohydrolase family protein [Phycisphaerae bacterium]HOM53292.1 cyclodeaminase/cyclohydrolase family protein [Phycisphaerae bacterium]HON68126.1 cyclodeaminase/cyclohydrolase family protein [Phycisphaerae bacterium]HPP28417.1 cyclodeaminase/cyclohydrolase family protein [Phycisphaerae bacterium]